MNCSTPCFNHEHRQGKGCACAMRATRTAWTCDPDEPIEVPIALRVLCVLAAIVCIVVSSGALDCYFPKVNPQCSSAT